MRPQWTSARPATRRPRSWRPRSGGTWPRPTPTCRRPCSKRSERAYCGRVTRPTTSWTTAGGCSARRSLSVSSPPRPPRPPRFNTPQNPNRRGREGRGGLPSRHRLGAHQAANVDLAGDGGGDQGSAAFLEEGDGALGRVFEVVLVPISRFMSSGELLRYERRRVPYSPRTSAAASSTTPISR